MPQKTVLPMGGKVTVSDLTFTQLKKLSRLDRSGLAQYKLAVMGDCATQHLATALRGYAIHTGLGLSVFDADYNQIDVQTMDAGSELYAFAPNAVLIQMCTEKLYKAFCETPLNRRASFAEDTYARICQVWKRINANMQSSILQCSFPLLDDGAFGQYGSKTPDSFLFQQRKLNYLLMQGCQEVKNVYLIDLDAIQAACGRKVFSDPRLYYIAKMPVSLEALPAVAKAVVDQIQAPRSAWIWTIPSGAVSLAMMASAAFRSENWVPDRLFRISRCG